MTERQKLINEAKAMPLVELAEQVLCNSFTSGVHDTVLIDRCRFVRTDEKSCNDCKYGHMCKVKNDASKAVEHVVNMVTWQHFYQGLGESCQQFTPQD